MAAFTLEFILHKSWQVSFEMKCLQYILLIKTIKQTER